MMIMHLKYTVSDLVSRIKGTTASR